MYKVFLVEDEVIVREGLRDNIPWEQYGFTFVGEAGDGEIALPLIRKTVPDVLITDIKMPFMDGLSLCRVVRSQMPQIRIVILSGYDDFEYARRAIEIGVDQYLSKPVTRRAMTRMLGELAKKLDEEKERENSLFSFRKEQHAYEQFKRRQFFEDVFAGRFTVEDIFREAERLRLDLTGPSYRVLLADVFEADSEKADALRCREDVLRYFLRHPQYLVTEWVNRCLCVIVRGQRETVEMYTRRAEEKLQEMVRDSEGMDYFLCVSGMTDRFSGLKDCYGQVSRFFACRYMDLPERVITEENYAALAAKPGQAPDDPRKVHTPGEGGEEPDTAGAGHILQKALEYIDENFTDENLSLLSAAGAANVSQGYFSALFSQKMGMTFIEYVTEKRIEKAKQLLSQTREHTAAVSAMVGYKDPNYFRSVFKKMTGCTPREYRNSSV